MQNEYHTATPFLIIKDASKAMEFYKIAFHATELMRMTMPDGKIGYAEIRIGNSIIMLADEYPEMGSPNPKSLNGSSPVRIHLYVENVDELATQAIAAGAKLIRPLEDQFFGDRLGSIEDPFGHLWNIATKKEKITREEMVERFNAIMKQ
jgi:PhnB protein